jgi:hypothetical protein
VIICGAGELGRDLSRILTQAVSVTCFWSPMTRRWQRRERLAPRCIMAMPADRKRCKLQDWKTLAWSF